MQDNLLMSKERMIAELTKYRNPNLTKEQAEFIVERLSEEETFWMDVEKLFHDKATEIYKEIQT